MCDNVKEQSLCQIQWIDNHGIPTGDDNPAIGVAVCHMPATGEIAGPYNICKEHAKIVSDNPVRMRMWAVLPLR